MTLTDMRKLAEEVLTEGPHTRTEWRERADTLARTILDLVRMVVLLQYERDRARAVARVLVHAYTHDSRPPQQVIDEAFTYTLENGET